MKWTMTTSALLSLFVGFSAQVQALDLECGVQINMADRQRFDKVPRDDVFSKVEFSRDDTTGVLTAYDEFTFEPVFFRPKGTYQVEVYARFLEGRSKLFQGKDALEITAVLKRLDDDTYLGSGVSTSDRVYTQKMYEWMNENEVLKSIFSFENAEYADTLLGSQDQDVQSVLRKSGVEAARAVAVNKGLVAADEVTSVDIVCQVEK